MEEERDSRKHIEAVPVRDFDDNVLPVSTERRPMPQGGALQTGHLKHGAGFRNSVTPTIREKAAEIREIIADEYPGIELSLPTVELFCQAMARSVLLNNYIMEFVENGRIRKVKGVTLRGIEAVPSYIWAEAGRAEQNAAKFGQDLGLDLTGRAKALKDDAIKRSLDGNNLASLANQGRKLRSLRGRSA